MTPERLAQIRAFDVGDPATWVAQDEGDLVSELLVHIDAQAARIAELERLLDAKITRVDVDAARARAAHAEARIAELEEQVRVEVARKSKLLLAREPVIADVVYEGEKLIDRLKAAEARALAAETALAAMFAVYEGVYDMAVPDRHQSEEAKRACDLAESTLAQPKVTP